MLSRLMWRSWQAAWRGGAVKVAVSRRAAVVVCTRPRSLARSIVLGACDMRVDPAQRIWKLLYSGKIRLRRFLDRGVAVSPSAAGVGPSNCRRNRSVDLGGGEAGRVFRV